MENLITLDDVYELTHQYSNGNYLAFSEGDYWGRVNAEKIWVVINKEKTKVIEWAIRYRGTYRQWITYTIARYGKRKKYETKTKIKN
jgi:hypothetical protein